ncbi:MAG: flagellar export chaperone FliS [Hydrogenibacillus schlegelii]|nr:flagellar export chaperone FliS [Hydrogenibacillus schlegelii]
MYGGAMQYRMNQVLTAPPEELVLLLYDAAIKSGRQAIRAIAERDYAAANDRLIHMQEVLAALIRGLDLERPPARELYQLYDFMTRHLIAANLKKDAQNVKDVLALLEDLRETWAQAIRLARAEGAADRAAAPDDGRA